MSSSRSSSKRPTSDESVIHNSSANNNAADLQMDFRDSEMKIKTPKASRSYGNIA